MCGDGHGVTVLSYRGKIVLTGERGGSVEWVAKIVGGNRARLMTVDHVILRR
jgi:hypothetical protein